MSLSKSFGKWWKATKEVASETGSAVYSGAASLGSKLASLGKDSSEEEKIKLIMSLQNVDEETAKKILAEHQQKADEDTANTATLDNLKK